MKGDGWLCIKYIELYSIGQLKIDIKIDFNVILLI